MKRTRIILMLTIITFALTACTGCEEQCDKNPTYRPEVGIGYVFRYDSTGCYPVAGARITVDNKYWTHGMYGADYSVGKEYFYTDADGRYQVRYIEKKCITFSDGRKEMVYCNEYDIYCNGIYIKTTGGRENLDTIKLYE